MARQNDYDDKMMRRVRKLEEQRKKEKQIKKKGWYIENDDEEDEGLTCSINYPCNWEESQDPEDERYNEEEGNKENN